MNRFKLLYFIFIVLAFTQCMQDEYNLDKLDDDIEITAGVLTPLAYGTLSIDDIISEFDSTSFISSDADGLLMITYEDSLFSFMANDLMEVPAQDFIQFFIESDFTVPPGWGIGEIITIDSTKTFPFSFENGEALDSIILNQGDMVFNISSEFLIPAEVIITCPSIRNDQGVFTDTILVGPGGSVNPTPAPLDGYTIALMDSVTIDSTYNYLPVDFKVILTNEGAGINAGEDIEITATIENIIFEAIFGYIGDYELVSENGEIPLDFFENSIDGDLYFEDPIINLLIENSYGVPTEFSISRFTGFNNDADSVELTFTFTNNNIFDFSYPKISDYINNDIIRNTTISINRDSSNIPEFLGFMPSNIEYSLSAQSNPPGSDSSNFVSADSELNIDLELILPLWFSADSFAFEETMDMNFFEDADYIENVYLILDVLNGLPLDIDFQVYFLDSLDNHVDTLFSAGDIPIIKSGIVDPITSTVVSPYPKKTTVAITKDRFTKLEKVKKGIIRAGLKTTPDDSNQPMLVKFYTDYEVEFNLSVVIDVKTEL